MLRIASSSTATLVILWACFCKSIFSFRHTCSIMLRSALCVGHSIQLICFNWSIYTLTIWDWCKSIFAIILQCNPPPPTPTPLDPHMDLTPFEVQTLKILHIYMCPLFAFTTDQSIRVFLSDNKDGPHYYFGFLHFSVFQTSQNYTQLMADVLCALQSVTSWYQLNNCIFF